MILQALIKQNEQVYTQSMSDGALIAGTEMLSTMATVEQDGETQVIRLPKGLRLEGDRFELCRKDGGLLLRPVVAARRRTREEIDAFWARLDSYGADPLFPDGRDQGAFEVRDAIR